MENVRRINKKYLKSHFSWSSVSALVHTRQLSNQRKLPLVLHILLTQEGLVCCFVLVLLVPNDQDSDLGLFINRGVAGVAEFIEVAACDWEHQIKP